MSDKRIDAPRQPAAAIAYGNVIYWVSVAAALICTIGPFIAVVFPANNVLNPHYLFYAVWQGKNAQQVWKEAGQGFPGAHFWLANLLKGDGLTHFGIVLGCSSAGLSFVAAAFAYLRRSRREVGWAVVALASACLVLFALLGVIQVGE